jgi:hypothetical protein
MSAEIKKILFACGTHKWAEQLQSMLAQDPDLVIDIVSRDEQFGSKLEKTKYDVVVADPTLINGTRTGNSMIPPSLEISRATHPDLYPGQVIFVSEGLTPQSVINFLMDLRVADTIPVDADTDVAKVFQRIMSVITAV